MSGTTTGIRWARAILRAPAVMAADLLPAVAEVLAGAGPVALEIHRTEAGIRWAILAPEDRLPGILEGLQAASGRRLLPGPGEQVGTEPAPRGTFFAPVPSIPVLPPVRPAIGRPARKWGRSLGRWAICWPCRPARAVGSGCGAAIRMPPPDPPHRPGLRRSAPEASAWELWWRVAWGMALGGSLLAGISLQLLLVFPEALAALPPEGVFLVGALGVAMGTMGISALIRFWEWRHLSPEALREKLRTALLEASLEVWGPPAGGRTACLESGPGEPAPWDPVSSGRP
ncbi:MAG: hypothetical protein RMM07_11915 [Anaerolineae bacterium]|nr:hypothetical protein [Anaerolineae bacterium]